MHNIQPLNDGNTPYTEKIDATTRVYTGKNNKIVQNSPAVGDQDMIQRCSAIGWGNSFINAWYPNLLPRNNQKCLLICMVPSPHSLEIPATDTFVPMVEPGSTLQSNPWTTSDSNSGVHREKHASDRWATKTSHNHIGLNELFTVIQWAMYSKKSDDLPKNRQLKLCTTAQQRGSGTRF